MCTVLQGDEVFLAKQVNLPLGWHARLERFRQCNTSEPPTDDDHVFGCDAPASLCEGS